MLKQVQHDKMVKAREVDRYKRIINADTQYIALQMQRDRRALTHVPHDHPELVSGSEESNSQMLKQVIRYAHRKSCLIS